MHAELIIREPHGPLGPVEEKKAPDVLYKAGNLIPNRRLSGCNRGSRKATPDGSIAQRP